ncbi:MAG: right-handed parallel beta-helix repeat-containing protein, partial [Candidatus Heimdallarchaeaceae archaeon]
MQTSMVSMFLDIGKAKAAGETVTLNEFVSNSAQEWVELYNNTENTIDLTGWKLTELSNPGGSPIENNMLILDGNTIDAHTVKAFNVSGLNNSEDSIGLYNGDVEIDRVTYGTVTGYTEDVAAPQIDLSAAKIPDGTGTWTTNQTPTKGTTNSGVDETLEVEAGDDVRTNSEFTRTAVVTGATGDLTYQWTYTPPEEGATLDLTNDTTETVTINSNETTIEGDYIVTITVTDSDDDPENPVSDSFTLTWEFADPQTATITTPENEQYYNNSNMPEIFSGKAADDPSGAGLAANSTKFYLKNSNDEYDKYWTGSEWSDLETWLTTTHNETTNDTEVTWTSNVSLPETYENGIYTTTVRVINKNGKTKRSSITFTVENSEFYVSPTGNDETGNGSQENPYATIQKAIDEIPEGGTVNVADGTYTENLVIDKDITLQSSGAAADTIINAADSSNYVVKITADGVTLDGFTITGLANGDENQAAVITWGVDNCTITNNILTDNYKDAINLYSIDGAYSDYNTVSNNVINGPNGVGETFGIKIKGSHNTISNNEIYNADTSIHIWSWDASETASPDYNIISGNTIAQGESGTANHKYGIILKTGRYNEVTGNTISVTRAGIHLYTSDRMETEADFDPRPANNIINGNIITGGEVGIVLLEGTNTNTISGNTISGTTIAGILGSLSRWPEDWSDSPSAYLIGTPQQYLQITGNTFTDNTLDNCGHGIAMEYADNNIIGQSDRGNTIKNNADTTAID